LEVTILSRGGSGCAWIGNGVAGADLTNNTLVAKLPVPSPEDLFAAPGGRRVFVLSAFGADTVSLIGTATNAVLASARVPGLAETRRAVSFSPEGCQTYVLSSDRDSISVLDAEAKIVRSGIATGRRPFAVSVARDGSRAYVVNSSSNSVTVIDTAAGTVLAAIPVGSDPRDIALHPNGRTAYVANVGAGTISVIDLPTNSVTASLPVPMFGGVSLVLSPDGTRLYVATVATLNSSAITVISTSTNGVVGAIRGNFSAASVPSLVFSSDGTRAYATESDGLLVIDVAANSAIGRVRIDGPRRIALSPDARRAYVTHSSGIAVVDTTALTVLTTIPVGAEPVGIVIVDPPPPPTFASAGLVNAAGFQTGAPLAPGEIASLFGTNLGPSTVLAAHSLPLPTAICGTSVTVGNVKAPLFFVSAGQLAFQVPYELPTGQQPVAVFVNDAASAQVTSALAPSSPGIFTLPDGKTAVAQDFGADGKSFFVLDPNNPDTFAAPGDFLVFYLSGLGQTSPVMRTNTPAPQVPPLPRLINEPVVTIGGVAVPSLFAGLTPGFVGLYQINVQLPNHIPSGDAVPVVVVAGGQTSNVASIPVKRTATSTLPPTSQVSYTTFKGERLTLNTWPGQNIVVLTRSSSLDASVMAALVSGLDRGFSVYAQITGRTPSALQPYVLDNRSTVAEVPDGATCGAGCAHLGRTGIEITSTSFRWLYDGIRFRNEYDQVVFYEFGRNFWFY
jgi:uncharacterized protein (TIGR03437 family)